MLKAKYEWNVRYPDLIPDQQIFNCLLKNRGIDDVDRFFSLGKEIFSDPYALEDMKIAVTRIRQAISNREKIVIYGDYDCDGITAIAVLYRTLKRLGARIAYDLPDRFSDGYGLSLRAVETLIAEGVSLVITVDNGITCFDEIDRLNEAGIDTIITDHHEPLDGTPKALAILHAKISKTYPFKELAGVGMSYKLASALSESDLDDLLDLVMIGTVADMVKLEGENQALVNLGLTRLKNSSNPGLRKLLEYSHVDDINLRAIAFKIAPKINSSGRMGKAKEAVELLICDSEEEVNRLILSIESNHAERKDLTDEAYRECEKLVNLADNVLVLVSPSFHEGVIGICAQKIAEKYQRSTIVMCQNEEGIGKGSMRSSGDEDILSLLKQSDDLLIRFGGHSQAAGLSIEIPKIPLLRERLNRLSVQQGKRILDIDMQISLSDISVPSIRKIEHYSFFTATFLFSNLTLLSKSLISGKHTKLYVTDGIRTTEALMFNNTEYFTLLEEGDRIDLVGGVGLNSWKNSDSIQIMIKDLSCDHFQVLDLRNEDHFTQVLPTLKKMDHTLILDDEIATLEFDLPSLVSQKKPSTVVVGYSARAKIAHQWLNKEGIGSIYRLIQQNEPLTAEQLVNLSKTPEWLILPILKIFEELHLISNGSSGITLLKTAEKRNLADSKTYQSMMNTRQQFEFLSNESLTTIKKYFINLMEA